MRGPTRRGPVDSSELSAVCLLRGAKERPKARKGQSWIGESGDRRAERKPMLATVNGVT